MKRNRIINLVIIIYQIMYYGRITYGLSLVARKAVAATSIQKRLMSSANNNLSSDYSYHIPVMRNECCDLLNIQEGGVYVDCTLGGGGHSKAILERGGKVIGIDQDPDAIQRANVILKEYVDSGHCEIIQTNFRNIRAAIAESRLAGPGSGKNGLVDGVLMDLGVSSFQINEATRGFAFGQDGPLDMRMNKGMTTTIGVMDSCSSSDVKTTASSDSETVADSQPTTTMTAKTLSASVIINEWDSTDIADVLYNYGDEVRSRVLAREIISARPLSTTGQLEAVISKVTPFKLRSKTLARCFQALRIVVNDEIGALEEALSTMHHCIRHNGMFVVMSYHSLEDRRVKQLFRTGSIDGKGDTVAAAVSSRRSGSGADTEAGSDSCPWGTVTKRAVVPSEEEILVNRRARSAKLRAAAQILLHKYSSGDSSESKENYGKPAKYKVKSAVPKIGAKQLAKINRRLEESQVDSKI